MQIPLPLETRARFAREDFIVAPGNSAAIGFIDSWPAWPAPSGALFGPAGSGKTHLVQVWAGRAKAQIIEAAALGEAVLPDEPLAVENVDLAALTGGAETALFALIERGGPLLLTGREPPRAWPAHLPDLVSRLGALIAFPLWAPDDALLAGLARKLFDDRQLIVPGAVIAQMIRALERSPGAVRDFVAKADRAALAAKRPVTTALIRELLAKDV